MSFTGVDNLDPRGAMTSFSGPETGLIAHHAVSKKACGAISLRRHCPDQVLGVAVQPSDCPASQPSRHDLGLPDSSCGPAPSLASQDL